MKNILKISRRELGRFRTRFRGGSRLVFLAIIAAALVISYLIAQQGLTLSRGIYTIGESPTGPFIGDSRFNVLTLDRATGVQMLDSGSIDVYIDGESVVARKDQRSQYAAGALKQYLDKQELSRLIDEYDINRSFPLRVEVNYLPVPIGASTSPGSIITATPTLVPSGPSATPIAVPTVAVDTSTAV